jgi:signal transduction histidine kinase
VEADVTPGALTQSVEILLDNALVHGTGDVEVTVSVNDGRDVEIAIRDEGRTVDSSGPNDGGAMADHRGHGLGLLLARNLLRPDGGRVELMSVAPTTFVITLPEQQSVRPSSSPSSVEVRTQSGSHLLTHEDRVGDGEQHNDSAN